MANKYQIICMSFDGEFKRESFKFDTIDEAWEYSNDLGSKWFFYPFHFVVSDEKIVDTFEFFENFKNKKITTIQKIFLKVSKTKKAQNVDCDKFCFLVLEEIERIKYGRQ